ncbi:hypothetical protein EC973_007713 [Apophysomyces ossiformis]|uniref:Mitochondrial carrier protein n=1 Tax=Apophysomyces ossiformis TaxID=679940 RepID=A0A8H7EUE3_9FUNG|nr:hypothetical protein EC973_007713 [Apophysomyces ossiformis]
MTDVNELELFETDTGVQPPSTYKTTSSGSVSSVERMMAACSGAILTTLLVTPLDVIKTRLQSQVIPGSVKTQQLHGTWDGITKIVRHEGIPALWRGLSAGLVMAIPSTIIYFVGYDYIRDQTQIVNQTLHDYSPLWAGGAARVVAAAVISPIELFRTRLQSVEGLQGFGDVWRGVVRMVHKDGVSSLWRGLLPTMLRDVPFSAVYWMGYERIKDRLQPQTVRSNDAVSQFHTSFVAGASSGMIAAVITTPFDVIKTQRQVSSIRADIRFSQLLRNIVATEGYQGFFRGVVPRVIKVAPSCAIMISSYEVGKLLFADRRNTTYTHPHR